jgi:hypothetical protein
LPPASRARVLDLSKGAPITAGLQLLQVDAEAVVKHVKREVKNFPEAVQTMLLDCAVQLSTKVPLYALIVGTCAAPPTREAA